MKGKKIKTAWRLFAAALMTAGAVWFGGNAAFAAGVTINETNFPDEAFRKHVAQYDKNHNGILSDTERKAVKILDCHGPADNYHTDKGIGNIKGLEYFTELTELYCQYNALTSLDLSQNKKLEKVDCSYNKLKNLTVSANVDLIYLNCRNNDLDILDVRNNTALTNLTCGLNSFTELDLSNQEALVVLDCENIQMTSLDVSHNPELAILRCKNCGLKELDVRNNPQLYFLECYGNQFTALDVRNNESIKNTVLSGTKKEEKDYFQYSNLATRSYLRVDKFVGIVTEQQYHDMHRLYNPNSGEHFYTASAQERDFLVSVGWNYEGVAWKAPELSLTPVFRLYNPNAGDHHYTASKEERSNLVSAGWIYEGIGWYGKAQLPDWVIDRPFEFDGE